MDKRGWGEKEREQMRGGRYEGESRRKVERARAEQRGERDKGREREQRRVWEGAEQRGKDMGE